MADLPTCSKSILSGTSSYVAGMSAAGDNQGVVELALTVDGKHFRLKRVVACVGIRLNENSNLKAILSVPQKCMILAVTVVYFLQTYDIHPIQLNLL